VAFSGLPNGSFGRWVLGIAAVLAVAGIAANIGMYRAAGIAETRLDALESGATIVPAQETRERLTRLESDRQHMIGDLAEIKTRLGVLERMQADTLTELRKGLRR
jgi:hypothetical protein